MTIQEKKEKFMQTYAPMFFLVQKITGMDARMILAQCALETDWGTKIKGNNLFGIKAFPGDPFVEFESYEYDGKKLELQSSKFKQYASPCESLLDYIRKMKDETRYYLAWLARDEPSLYFEHLQDAGYATDPMYKKKCLNVMRSLPEWKE